MKKNLLYLRVALGIFFGLRAIYRSREKGIAQPP